LEKDWEETGMTSIAQAFGRLRERAVPVLTVWSHRGRKGLFQLLIYIILFAVAFTFLLPIVYMTTTGLMTIEDYIDPGVHWVPRSINWENFELAWQGLHYPDALKNSAIIAILAAVGQVISAGVTGYAFGRMKFPGRDILFVFLLFTFIVPPQTIIVPLFMLFKELEWIDTYNPFIVPAFFAQGLRGSLFVLIFRQFFMKLPYELEDAARIDGCGEFRTFTSIMLPLARPAILVTFLFSLVWHWNDFYEPMMYLMKTQNFTMPLRLSILWTSLNELTGGQAGDIYNQPLIMAACFLVILPPLILYMFTQRYFVEGVERTGLVD
jgi:multiple sugar transport system permease protein